MLLSPYIVITSTCKHIPHLNTEILEKYLVTLGKGITM